MQFFTPECLLKDYKEPLEILHTASFLYFCYQFLCPVVCDAEAILCGEEHPAVPAPVKYDFCDHGSADFSHLFDPVQGGAEKGCLQLQIVLLNAVNFTVVVADL